MATTSAFASPLGPLHYAHPSTAASHTLLSLFRPSSSSESKAASRPAKCSKKELRISSPVLQSTTNLSIAAPAYSAAFTAPRPFRREEGDFPMASTSAAASADEERSASPPPPYRRSSSFELGDHNADEPGHPFAALQERALIDAEQVERRMHQWDAERRLCRAERGLVVDQRMGDELRALGL